MEALHSKPAARYFGDPACIAKADMMLVEGEPTVNLDLVADPERNFRVIMKAG